MKNTDFGISNAVAGNEHEYLIRVALGHLRYILLQGM